MNLPQTILISTCRHGIATRSNPTRSLLACTPDIVSSPTISNKIPAGHHHTSSTLALDHPTCDQVWVVMELCDDAAGAGVALNAVQLPISSRFDEVKTQLQEGTADTKEHSSLVFCEAGSLVARAGKAPSCCRGCSIRPHAVRLHLLAADCGMCS
jgi:hypothetical protein